MKTSPTDDLQDKVVSTLEYNPQNILSITKSFSEKYPVEWLGIRKENDEESVALPPLKSMRQIISVLDYLENSGLVFSNRVETGHIINLSRTWRVRNDVNPEYVTLQIPRLLKRLYTQLSNAANLDINTVIVNSLKQYVEQRILSSFTVVDIVKVVIVDNYGSSEFSRDSIIPLLKDKGVYSMVDLTLDSYCINLCGNSGDDLFLYKLDNGKYKLDEK